MRIIELEDELSQQPPKKRARKGDENVQATSVPSGSNPAPSAASVKADEKKRKM